METLIASIAALLLMTEAADTCGVSPCAPGCYIARNKSGLCESVPFGHFSPAADDAMYECPAGTFATGGASRCTPCEAGSYASYAGSGSCLLCTPGEYASKRGSLFCNTCNGMYYFGPGSDAVYCNDGQSFCLQQNSALRGYPSMAQYIKRNTAFLPSKAFTVALVMVPQVQSTQPSTQTPLSSAEPSIQASTEGPTVTARDKRLPDSPTQLHGNRPQTATPSSAPAAVPSSISSKPRVGDQHRNERRQAFGKYFPLLVAACVIALIAAIVKRTKTKKRRRPLRKVPPPPPQLDREKTPAAEVDDSGMDDDQRDNLFTMTSVEIDVGSPGKMHA